MLAATTPRNQAQVPTLFHQTASGNLTAVSSKSFRAHAVKVPLGEVPINDICCERKIMTPWMSLAVRLQAVALCLVLSTNTVSASQAADQNINTGLVRQAFTNWQQGQGTVFDLLAPDATWIVSGSSPVSGVYNSRTDLIERAVRPITARLATPISPTVQSIVAEGDVVVVLWKGEAMALDRKPYNNTYLWHMTLKDGQITEVKAFLDTYVLNDLMRRVDPVR
ncbi:nuclear transport factor 2 family protein [Pseudomonas sp.]|uniref:nuclear transport factor 2 family protein n=1 Tax=Pseudomonas sp. TaxID=306 RepID=UPI003A96CA87